MTPGSAVYTGTHDNTTTRAWFTDELDEAGRKRFFAYAGREIGEADAADVLLRMALGSVARLCVVPLQDYLGLGAEGRMNVPGVAGGNWSWRAGEDMLTQALAARMRGLAEIYGRLPG